MKDAYIIPIEILLLTDLLNTGAIDDKVYNLAIDKIRKDNSIQTNANLLSETA